jgi:SAM-dependent methyltransferase
MANALPRLYTDLASWYLLLTAREDYVEEEQIYREAILAASAGPPRTLLELGCGGGNMAWHYKRWVEATLTDVSPAMLELSRVQNPECQHVLGDMRTIRLGRLFDVVLVHDAVVYLLTEADLRAGIETAALHCKPGGVALFAPDHTRESFIPSTDCGGHDGDGRALRYLEWQWDPDPVDTAYTVHYTYVLREDGQPMRVESEEHTCAMFPRDTWFRLLEDAGFDATLHPLVHSEVIPGSTEYFIAVKRPR